MSDRSLSRPPDWLLGGAVLALFTAWSLSFVSIEALLRDGGPARFDWLSLTIGRFVPVSCVCGAYCLLARREESLSVLRRHPGRAVLCGLLVVPGYNFALYLGQQYRVAAPIASLLTALAPLFVMALSGLFLGERITTRRILGFALVSTV